MIAIAWTKYRPPNGLPLREVENPTPKDNESLIRVHATTVTAGECEMRSLKFPVMYKERNSHRSDSCYGGLRLPVTPSARS
jgi:NADPH:quinone reductase-like Zn-dependent oxidoreductase